MDMEEVERLTEVIRNTIYKEIMSHRDKMKHLDEKSSKEDEVEYFILCTHAVMTNIAFSIAKMDDVECALELALVYLKKYTFEFYEDLEKKNNG